MLKKDEIVNEVLVKMQMVVGMAELQMLEAAMVTAMYCVDVIAKETALSTALDDNSYLLDVYEMNVRKDGLSDKSIKQYLNSMRNMLATVDKNIRQITSMDIKYYLDQYAVGNQPSTVNNERRFLSAVFTWLRKHGIVAANPVEPTPIRKERKKPIDYLRGEEVEYLRNSCKDLRDRALLEFLLSTGVRIGEVSDIQQRDINWQSGEVLIYASKTQDYRTVYLNDVAKVHLKEYLDSRTDHDTALFVTNRRPYTALKEPGLQSIIRQIGKRSGLGRRIYPHLMRKTMATTLRHKDCPIEDIQQMLGHANASTTLGFYAASSTEHLRQSHRKYMAQGA